MNPEVLDREELMERVGGDMEFLQEIAEVFTAEGPKLLSEIRRAMERADAPALERSAHSLKGAVANFGGEQVRQAAYRLEAMGRAADFGGAEAAYAALELELRRFHAALNTFAKALLAT